MNILLFTLNGSSLGALGSLSDRLNCQMTILPNDQIELSGLEDWTEAIAIAVAENPDITYTIN
jgi:hypothetical protein